MAGATGETLCQRRAIGLRTEIEFPYDEQVHFSLLEPEVAMNGKILSAPPDQFRFGWRYVRKGGGNGASEWVRQPLTLDDILHPHEGDHIPENTQQEKDVHYLAAVLRLRLADRPEVKVLADCLVNWGVKGVRNHSPDIAVFDGVADPKRLRKTFRVVKEGARCLLALEVVSPDSEDAQARDNDVVTKVEEYHKVGVPLYVIVDQEEEEAPRKLVGYRRGTKKYEEFSADNQGRLHLEPVGLLIGLRDEQVVCWDDRTGEEIPDLTGMDQARRKAEKALAVAQARIAELEAQERTRPGKPRRKK